MGKYIDSNDWVPVDNFELESNAYATAISEENRIIIAGPGAGKTELLAQRACYLLQTNICPSPKKILAISFKRDAAYNLAARVEKRVGRELSKRFTSLTFDAFSKSLVDRFLNGLPEFYRPRPHYRIEVDPTPPLIVNYFEKHSPGITKGTEKAKNCIRSLTNDSYPLHSGETLTLSVLADMFKSVDRPIVTFPILSRLAQLILYSNPTIVQYLRQTYSFIFLDEFQDTTRLQYDLFKTAFHGSKNVITAVGDTKQRIMLWAGAMDGIFESFKTDFSALDLPLLTNFRSAPRLIKLQNHLAQELMGSSITCIPAKSRDKEEGIAEFWFFDDYSQESKFIADTISNMVIQEGLDPREICLLYKQRPDHFAEELQRELIRRGITARIENELQDLLVEPIIQFLMSFVFSALSQDSRIEREFLLHEYSKYYKIYDDESFLKLEREVIKTLKAFRNHCTTIFDWPEIEELIMGQVNTVSFPVFRAYYPQYNEKTYFDQCVARFLEAIRKNYEEDPNLLSATEKFAGKGCLPIMTIHKSKGLEFSRVFFVGFEDQNFWTYRSQPDEDTCTFFVALSRAKDAVYFTFSRSRVNTRGYSEIRSIDSIIPMFKSLRDSGLVTERNFMTGQ